MTTVEHIVSAQNEVGEGPIWSVNEKALYWVDMESACYFRLDAQTGKHERFTMEVNVSIIAFRAAGDLLMGTARGFEVWSSQTRTLHLFGNPEAENPAAMLNDGAVDRHGRFWAGSKADGYKGSLYRLDPDRTLHKMDTGFDISNGIGWSPDNKTMYFTDSTPAIIYAYDYDAETGSIANRRVFVDSSDRPGVPDGLTVDQAGFVWSARWGGSCIDRYSPDGRLDQQIQIPALCPSSVAFGGDDLRDLYVTSARIDLTAEARQHPTLDGDLFRVRVEVGGFAESFYAG